MTRKVMFNFLELAFSPVSNYVFSLIKKDTHFQYLTNKSSLYVIAQRNEIVLDNLHFEPAEKGQLICYFEIRQKGNPSILNCELPVYQPNIASDISRDLKFHFEYALPKPDPVPKTFPHGNIVNLLFSYHDDTFVSWISPENFIQNFLNGAVEANVTGPIEEFLKYKVHYVGKATEQTVWKRLTGHSTLQEILSLEYPFHFGTLPTHEIAILFFKFRDAYQLHTISPQDEITQEVIDSLMGRNLPSEKTITLDAEKALIQAMQPKYNKEFYKNYPKSKDGLYSYDLDAYTFKIHSNIVLEYENGKIKGSPNLMGADSIVVEKNQPLKVLSNESPKK